MIITTMRRGKLSIEPGARTVWLRDDEYRRLLNEQTQEICEALTPAGLVCIEVDGELKVAHRDRATAGIVAERVRAQRAKATRVDWRWCAFAGLIVGLLFVVLIRSCT